MIPTQTFTFHMFPTLFSLMKKSDLSASCPVRMPSSEDSSLSPCSFARCNRQMKQKLVLISSILSRGYDSWRPEITWLKTRASDGSVGGGALWSTFYKELAFILEQSSFLTMFPSSSSPFGAGATTISRPRQIFSFSLRTSTLFARLA